MDSKLLRLDLEMQFFSPAVMDILTIVHKKGRKGGREENRGRKMRLKVAGVISRSLKALKLVQPIAVVQGPALHCQEHEPGILLFSSSLISTALWVKLSGSSIPRET